MQLSISATITVYFVAGVVCSYIVICYRINLDVILNLNAYGVDSKHDRLHDNLSIKQQSERVLNAGDHRDSVSVMLVFLTWIDFAGLT